MARIRDEDIALVRERARIDDVVREHVALKPAGGGSWKGLCPFHDERSPSFHVTPSRGFFHCFGCQEGGDVITFVMKVDHLTFAEAVEKLAARFGVQLRYEEGGAAPARQQGQRTRLAEANKAAAVFFTAQLASDEASAGRRFLAERGFESDAIDRFGVGYAPKGWDHLTGLLRRKGFSDQELLAAGLVSQGNRGVYDRFRGRLVWPIRDLSGDVVGFGARRLYDDDQGPKYLNTPETPLYKKSQVLYGIDLARKDIAKQQRAVVVEGYTDVMACHLAGVTTAVATCGTAFGEDHVRVLRRLLMDQDELRGEVVFTFDGDEAGRRAALRAFEGDQRFVTRTFVAVEPNGLDPCELRQTGGDQAVNDLIGRRVPMFEFAIRATLSQYDLDTAEGRVAGLRDAAPVVARIRDRALRPEYARLLAGWLGLDVRPVMEAVAAAGRAEAGERRSQGRPVLSGPQDRDGAAPAADRSAPSPTAPGQRGPAPDTGQPARPGGPTLAGYVERESLKAVLQAPADVAEWYDAVEDSAYTLPAYAAVHRAVVAAGGAATGASTEPRAWGEHVIDAAADDRVRTLVTALLVEPLRVDPQGDEAEKMENRYTVGIVARLLEFDAGRRIAQLKGRLQRIDPATDPEGHDAAFRDLLALEQYRRELAVQAGGEV